MYPDELNFLIFESTHVRLPKSNRQCILAFQGGYSTL